MIWWGCARPCCPYLDAISIFVLILVNCPYLALPYVADLIMGALPDQGLSNYIHPIRPYQWGLWPDSLIALITPYMVIWIFLTDCIATSVTITRGPNGEYYTSWGKKDHGSLLLQAVQYRYLRCGSLWVLRLWTRNRAVVEHGAWDDEKRVDCASLSESQPCPICRHPESRKNLNFLRALLA